MITLAMNEERIEFASRLFEVSPYDEHGKETSLIDILSDLRHYCYFHDIDFSACIRSSENHFNEEIEGYE